MSTTFRLSFKRYQRPFRSPVRMAERDWPVREGVIVRLEAESGKPVGEPGIGFGEAAPIAWAGTESMEVIEAFLGNYRGHIGLTEISAIPDRLPCTRFALESALEMARGRDKPNLMEDTPWPSLDVAALLPAGEPSIRRMDVLKDKGYRSFKWKIGLDRAEPEMEIARQLARQLPPGGRLRLDANGSLAHAEAMRWLKVLDELPVDYFEQPLPPDQIEGMKDLARYYATPIALDESVTRFSQIRLAVSDGWKGPLVIKPSLVGPITAFRAWRATRMCRLIYSSAFETAVGFEAVLRVAASDTRDREPAGFGTLEVFPDDDVLGLHPPGPIAKPLSLTAEALEVLWNRL